MSICYSEKMTPFIDLNAISKVQQRCRDHLLRENPIISEVTERLLNRLDYIRIQPKEIVNYGWHPHEANRQLKKRFPEAVIHDVDHLKSLTSFSNESIDLIVGNFALMRERDPIYLLKLFSQLLNEEGLLLFTGLGPDTFMELRQSFLPVDPYVHVHPFTDMHDIGDWMKQLHFSDPVVDREEMILAYDDVNLFFQDLKQCGATNVHQSRQRGLLSRNKWQMMRQNYDLFKTDNYFPVTLEVIYGHGWKIKWIEAVDEIPGEIAISIDSIKVRK